MTDAPSTASPFDIMRRNVTKHFPGVTWHPSREAWDLAVDTHPDVDPGKVVLDYIRKNRYKRNVTPSDDHWLAWVAQEDKHITEMRLRIEAEQKSHEVSRKGIWWPDV